MSWRSWRIDWCLLATGLISLGLTVVQKGRSDLLRLLGEDQNSLGQLLTGAGGVLVPVSFLSAFVFRLGWRVVTRNWY